MLSKQEIMATGDAHLLHTYNRRPLVPDHGEGMYLYDTDGVRYLDFCAGIAVYALGYGDRIFNDGLKAQVDKLLHTSNYFYNEPAVLAAKKLTELSGMDRVFFTNSGTEAIEGAIKLARRYQYSRGEVDKDEIVAMQHSFHGRSMGALSVTGKASYRTPFEPLIGGVKFADLNDIDSVKAVVSERTAAILVEPIQGEGGIYEADDRFLQDLREICNENKILLIFDEIQCGLGRTGQMFAWEKSGVKPDVMTLAKALGCGVPVGAFLCMDYCAALVPGDHGSTYGGNPFVTTAVNLSMQRIEELHLTENAAKAGAYLWDKLEELMEQEEAVIAHRGRGLMQGIALKEEVSSGRVVANALNHHLILINADGNVIRFLPPLIVSEKEIDEMIPLLRQSIREAM